MLDNSSINPIEQEIILPCQFAGCLQHCIVKRCGTTRDDLAHALTEHSGIIGVVLKKSRGGVESHDEYFVFALTKRRVKEPRRSLPLEAKLVAYASAAIDKHRDIQWNIGFGAEIRDLLKPIVFENVEIFSPKIRDELSLTVGHRKENIHALHIDR